jgi:hypothetical protein
MKKMQEKTKRYKYTRQITSSPSNQAIGMANTNFETQEGSNQNTIFLNGKNHTPTETKAIKTSTKLNQKNQLP